MGLTCRPHTSLYINQGEIAWQDLSHKIPCAHYNLQQFELIAPLLTQEGRMVFVREVQSSIFYFMEESNELDQVIIY